MERWRRWRTGWLFGLWIGLLVHLAFSGAQASEITAPVEMDIAVTGAPRIGGTVNAVVTVMPEVDCERLSVRLDLQPELALVGGTPSWMGAARQGVPIRLSATVRIAGGGILPLGATVVAQETATELPLTKTHNVYLEVAGPGRAIGRVLPQAPVPSGGVLDPPRPARIIRGLLGRANGTATVRGKFVYTDKEGATQPIAGCRVRLLEGNAELQVGTTGTDGSFSFSVAPGKTYVVEIRSEATDGSRVKVVLSLPANVHWTRWRAEVPAAAGGSTVDLGELKVHSYQHTATAANYAKDQSGAFHILDRLRQGQRYIETLGATLQDVTAIWYPGYSIGSSSYSRADGVMRLRGQQNNPGQWQSSVILHEYGHFVHHKYSTNASPGGSHPSGQQDQTFAYSEGWATFLMGAILNDPVYRTGSPGNEVSYDFSTKCKGWGKQNEWDVAGMLWDVLQTTSMNKIWQVFTVNKPTTMQEFANAWFYDENRSAGQKSLGSEEALLTKWRARRKEGRPGILNVVRIVTPTAGARVHAGPFNNPRRFQSVVQLRWDDNTILTDAIAIGVRVPPGASPDTATVVFTQRNKQYELDVRQPPQQKAEGFYDLVISAIHNEDYLLRKESGGNLVDEATSGAVSTTAVREQGVEYGERKGLELALILDSSGSMSWNDPGDYRKSAAKMLVDMAEEGDAIAVVDFDWSVRTWAPLTTITGKPGQATADRNALKAAIDKVDSDGGTNIEDGLQRGYNELAASPTNAPKAAILLTDGQGTYTGTATAQFVAKGWPVYTIALTGDADEALLRSIASSTGGEYAKAPTQHALADLFARLRGAPKGESTIASKKATVQKGDTVSQEVTIDNQLESVTFTTTWSGSTLTLNLERPDGTIVNQNDPGVTFGSSSRFAFYTVEKPMPGIWKMHVTGTDVPAAGEEFVNTVTGPSPLSLNLFSVDANYLKGKPVRLALSLYERATPIVGANVTATITRPDGSQPAPALAPSANSEDALEELLSPPPGRTRSRAGTVTETVTLLDDGQHNDGAANDGLYAADYSNTNVAGDYVVDITAEGQTTDGQPFSRITRQTFSVTNTPLMGLYLNKTEQDFGTVYASAQSGTTTFRVTSSLNRSQGLTLSAGNLRTPEGDVIPGSAVVIQPQAVDVPARSYAEFEVYVDVPAGTKAGTYTGELVAEGSGYRLVATLTVTVITESNPPSLTDVSPADGAILVNPDPTTFQAKVADSESGIHPQRIQVILDGVAYPHQFDPATGLVSLFADEYDSEDGTLAEPQGGSVINALKPGPHTIVFEAADICGNKAQVTVRYRIVAPPPDFGRGLRMVSIPAQLTMPSDANPFGAPELRAAWYPPGGQNYIFYGDPAFPAFGPQVPFWVKEGSPDGNHPVPWTGTVPDQRAAQIFSVKRGWNMIAHAFVDPVPWSLQGIRVRRNGEEKTLAEAWQAGWVEDYAWGWQPDLNAENAGTYFMVYDNALIAGVAGELAPWNSYWFKAHEDCDLILPPPGQSRRRVVSEARAVGGWSVPLQVRSRSGVDQVVLGAVAGQRDLSLAAPPDPPGGNRPVRVTLLRHGQPLAVDLRAGTPQTRQEWEIQVVSPASTDSPQELALAWPDLRGLPKEVTLTLADEATGARRSLRTTASYSFRMTEGIRRFRVIAQPRAGSALALTDLQVEPVRSGARAVRFTLSTAALVDLEVVSPTGRVVTVITRSHAGQAGLNRVLWSGSVSPGLYLVRATATTEDGASVQTIQPVMITR